MLGIDFLNQRGPITLAGQEFMDYQNKNLFRELSTFVADHSEEVFKPNGDFAGINFRKSKEDLTKLSELIFNATGINLLVHAPLDMIGNMGVDSGFIKPGHIFNIKNIESILSSDESSIARAFRRLKTDCLNGWVDTSTAKIGGDFSKVQFNLYLGPVFEEFINRDVLRRYKIGIFDAVAAIIIHELGHIFTGFLLMQNQVFDTVMPTLAAKMIINGNIYGKQRVQIVNETLKELGVSDRPDDKSIENADGPGLMIMFNKCIENRDLRRTLSLGTAGRGSEIYADLFAVRAGCPKALIAATYEISDTPILGRVAKVCMGLTIALSCTVLFPIAPIVGMISAAFAIWRLDDKINPQERYDSQYRRLKNILRDQAMHVNEADWLDKSTKVTMIKEAKEMEKMIDDAKPFFEGTFMQRLVGWYFSGSDFKAQQFEHYTDELLGHTLSLYKEEL